MIRIKLKFYTTLVLLVSFAATHVCADGINTIVYNDTQRRIAANRAGDLVFDARGAIVRGNLDAAAPQINYRSNAIRGILKDPSNVQVHVSATDADRKKIFQSIMAGRLLAKAMGNARSNYYYVDMMGAEVVPTNLQGHYKVLELMYGLADAMVWEGPKLNFSDYNGLYSRDRTAATFHQWGEETKIGLFLSSITDGAPTAWETITHCDQEIEKKKDTSALQKSILSARLNSIIEIPGHALGEIAGILNQRLTGETPELKAKMQPAFEALGSSKSVYRKLPPANRVFNAACDDSDWTALAKMATRNYDAHQIRAARYVLENAPFEIKYQVAKAIEDQISGNLWCLEELVNAVLREGQKHDFVAARAREDLDALTQMAMDSKHSKKIEAAWYVFGSAPFEIQFRTACALNTQLRNMYGRYHSEYWKLLKKANVVLAQAEGKMTLEMARILATEVAHDRENPLFTQELINKAISVLMKNGEFGLAERLAAFFA